MVMSYGQVVAFLSTLFATASGATTPALQATSVPLGNEVMFACRSDTPAVWVKQSPDLAQVVFLSHNGYPIDNSVDLERFAFSKVLERALHSTLSIAVYECDSFTVRSPDLRTNQFFISPPHPQPLG